MTVWCAAIAACRFHRGREKEKAQRFCFGGFKVVGGCSLFEEIFLLLLF
jgi:hypothetical protein